MWGIFCLPKNILIVKKTIILIAGALHRTYIVKIVLSNFKFTFYDHHMLEILQWVKENIALFREQPNHNYDTRHKQIFKPVSYRLVTF